MPKNPWNQYTVLLELENGAQDYKLNVFASSEDEALNDMAILLFLDKGWSVVDAQLIPQLKVTK